jgi:biofilm protein TabA
LVHDPFANVIFDHLSRQALYRTAHPLFAAGFDWLLALDPGAADGKYPIIGDDLFALVQGYVTTPPSEKNFEAHRERIDIQYVISGGEQMLCTSADGLPVKIPYDAGRDVMFFHEPPQASALACTPGTFAIFHPHDAHKPGCVLSTAAPIRKVVLKIRT